jgi:predicted RNase H-like HicB family nuclease
MKSRKLARKFQVVYEADAGGWHAFIPDVQGCRTWGRSLSEARRNIREALSTCEDVFSDAEAVASTAELSDDVKLPRAARHALELCLAARDEAARAAEEAKERTAAAARALTAAGCSLRDAGELLGVSQEAVRQALHAQPAAYVPGLRRAR